MALTVLDLFSGIGGFAYAIKHFIPCNSFEIKQFCENNDFCQELLKTRYKGIPVHPNIETFDTEDRFDVITMGFPCQDLSKAGKMLAFSGERSALFYEGLRIIRKVRPRYVVMENVSSLRKFVLPTILRELSRAGFDAEWANIRASDMGACHQRSRFYLLAYTNSDGIERKEPRPIYSKVWEKESIRRISSDYREYTAQPIICRADNGLPQELYNAIELLKSARDQATFKKAERGIIAAMRELWYRSDPATASGRGYNINCLRQMSCEDSQYAGEIEQERLAVHERLCNLWKVLSGETLKNDKNLFKRLLIKARQIQYCEKMGRLHSYERLKALGNSVVPQCAAVPLIRILELEKTSH